MVCKEEFLTWFKDLDSYKRIDMLCELINMCVPFELRFIGSYVEDMGKYSYFELRQQALFANNLEKLEKDPVFKNQTLYEETVRHKVLLNISLLKSRNYSVANWYSKKFLRTDYIEDLVQKEKDELVQNELLLLFTMAARHPAFSFDQKQFFIQILVQLYHLRDSRLINKSSIYGFPPGFGYPTVYRKVHDAPLPFNFPSFGVHHIEYVNHIRGWPGLHCGAPTEVPPFPPHQPPLQPPQPSTSPLVTSPNQSRGSSPHRTPVASRPPALSILTTHAPTAAMPVVPPGGVVSSAPGIPPPVPSGGMSIPPPPVVSLSTMMPIPVEALPQPSQLNQSSQPSPIYNQVKPGQPECDELNSALKEDSTSKPPLINAWHLPSTVEIKHFNGMRIPPYPQNNMRSFVDQMQSIALTDESSHYQSSSSNSSSPPDTPSNLPSTTTPHGPGRGPMDKNRTNGMPNYITPFGDATSPPPPPTFTLPYAHLAQNRFYTSASFRPNAFAYAQYPNQGADTNFPQYSFPCFPLLYSSYPPANPLPPRNPPGCYNCGATGHLGQDCTQQNIDEITQKKNYSVDFSPVQSDSGEK
ncbi:uncharacterized protein LOC143203087 [Rhynchophorus ferrugineus]|uniref:CCHC-type domain-containing protein n=1 Tax=Rhynchophorus ferrugineus TaxID=354439 RepID=A0A834HXU9_RHYFE|nr:hypothetical protein GWI33_017612 [Rhynchophorus ferrugineus]